MLWVDGGDFMVYSHDIHTSPRLSRTRVITKILYSYCDITNTSKPYVHQGKCWMITTIPPPLDDSYFLVVIIQQIIR